MKLFRIARTFVLALLVALAAVVIPAKPAAAVEVISISSQRGSIGQQVTISGQGFFASSTEARGVNIIFGSANPGGTVDYNTDVHQILATPMLSSTGTFSAIITIPTQLSGGSAPAAVTGGTYYVYVTYYFPSSTSQNGIQVLAITTYTVTPSYILVDKAEGIPGTEVMIEGLGFGTNEPISVKFDASPIAIVRGDVQTNGSGDFFGTVVAVPPSFGGIHTLSVTGATSGVSSEVSFTIKPTLSVTPSKGGAGSLITVTGSGYQPGHNISITFTGIDVATAVSDATGGFSTSFAVPLPTVGAHVIKASDYYQIGLVDEAQTSFEIVRSGQIAPETSAASPGNIGMELVLTGSGFTPNGSIIVGYDTEIGGELDQIGTGTAKADGTFSITVVIPKSNAGEHEIVAIDSSNANNTLYFPFIMESNTPPIPQPFKPEMNLNADALTYFDWADVTDPSGVTYWLQVATSSTFAADTLVVNLAGITVSEYTLTAEEKLQAVSEEAPYYWRVKAVDGAANQSEWTGAGSFSVGSSFGISQAVIYVIIGVFAILLAGFSFWLGRKTAYY